MKKLNITKEQFNRSRYFQKKYGTLEYVSESGKVFKTSKGKLLKFNEDVESEMDEQTMLDEIATKVRDLDWCEGIDFDDYEPILYVKTNDGREIGIKIKENPNPGEKLVF